MQLLEIPEQSPRSEIDEDIIEIFVEEIEEVQTEIVTNFNTWKNEPANTDSLETLRRCFHTMKGSGRLVGATVIGELGWRFENMLNRVIDGTLPANHFFSLLLDQVEKVLPSLIEQFQSNQPASDEVVLLISQADYLTKTKGQSLGDFDSSPNSLTKDTSQSEPQQQESESLKREDTTDAEPELSANAKPTSQRLPEMENFNDIDKVAKEKSSTKLDMGIKEIPKGSSEDIGSIDVYEEIQISEKERDTAELFEGLEIEGLEIEGLEIEGLEPEHLLEDLGDSEYLDDLETIELPDDLELEMLDSLDDLELETVERSEDEQTEVENTSIDIDEEITLDIVDSYDSTVSTIGEDDIETIDPQLLEIFNTEASQHLSELKKFFQVQKENSPLHIVQEVVRAFHTLNGSSRSVDFWAISEIAAPLENYANILVDRRVELTPNMLAFFNEAILLIDDLLNGKAIDKKQQQTLLDNVQVSFHSLSNDNASSKNRDAPETLTVVSPVEVHKDRSEFKEVPDPTDEFVVLFFEEADEILENTQSLLERWTAAPKNMQLMKELQRELHTLKGGARMVGIAPMGELSHHLESVLTRIVDGITQSSPKLQEIIQNSVDELAAMLAAIRSNVPLDMPEDLIQQINAALGCSEDEQIEIPVSKPGTAELPLPKTDVDTQNVEEPPLNKGKTLDEGTDDRIRVKASLIDKLTNLAGELSISRAHMEQQQGTIKNNLVEMDQTITRLRDQLRRLEIETEAQIISHFGDTRSEDDDEFDPLELDRFSVMQQLSRSLMESVNDLTNIQDFLNTITRQGVSSLIQQSRIGAELQDGIMRTRMVPFTRVSPRLQRIARLTARELHKQVDFVINGEEIEFERTVLNRVVAPLEHMLRNAIDHGIEDAKTRQQAGKASIAKIAIDLSKEGAELIIKLSDDGAGLNLLKIRKKAEERGLINPDTVINDHDLMQFVLEHGFSTAAKLTTTSGRGVGMDVAISEIKQLGGSLRIHSKASEGTTFEIRLPLSLTITQALLVQVGEETMAIPMNHVEAVMRLPRADVIGTVDDERHYQYMDNSYRIFNLGKLLGLGDIVLDGLPLIPTLLVRIADRRVALLVDGIKGSKEIVVKSVGSQIDVIRWIAGATILGDGRVVLILDMPTLTRVDTPTSHYVSPTKSEIEMVEEETSTKTIMIVDDSITVRKVTARFLKRQGMDVLTAKDGIDAIAQLQERVPDLMLLDVEMPRMDGYELATQIRHRPDLKHLPIIMITSRTGTKHREKAKKIGIDRYLGKPFNENELLENIHALLSDDWNGKISRTE
jgi:chemosensory pili system protein ChpA (sensor histidine kinase/response regulator)